MMLYLARNSLLGLGLVVFGWLLGSIFPAPGAFTALARERASPILQRLNLSPQGLAELRGRLSPHELQELSRSAALLASSTGDAIPIERVANTNPEEFADISLALPPRAPASNSAFEADLHLCPGMRINNAPPADENDRVENSVSIVAVNGVALAANPTHGACLSSGLGARDGRPHKGTDYYSRSGGAVFAAGAGVVIEKVYRDDYGNMLLIDHGGGVYTRYAHLSNFAADVGVGSHVTAGQQIGLMGNTASYPIPVHLHYEILLGNYATRARSFGLTPRSPFEFAAAGSAQTQIAAPGPVVPLQLTRDRRGGEQCPGGPILGPAVITIRHGDTLASIARACYGDEEAWRVIASCNQFLNERNRGGVSPLNGGDLLYVGDRMLLPAPRERCAGPAVSAPPGNDLR
jgi:murein DD-endopeptidase MepM/ murein hydrolase activator NlpD